MLVMARRRMHATAAPIADVIRVTDVKSWPSREKIKAVLGLPRRTRLREAIVMVTCTCLVDGGLMKRTKNIFPSTVEGDVRFLSPPRPSRFCRCLSPDGSRCPVTPCFVLPSEELHLKA